MDSNVIAGNINLEPQDDMEFESNEAAYAYYKEYAKSVGFGTAKLSSRRSRASKEFIDAKFSCIRYGNKQQSDDAINPRPSPKIGCKASMHVKRRPNGKWYIHSFVKEHNHDLLPAQAHLFRSHRNVDLLNNDSKIRRKKILAAVSKQYSAYQYTGSLENYIRNQHDKGRNLTLEEGDAQVLLELFVHMQEENPKFFYAVDLNEEHRLRNVFWVDAKGMDDYTNFGDVVSFDTTYVTNKSWTEEQFEKRWWKLLDGFNLREGEWMQSLYEDRKLWVPTFMRDISFAGLSTASRSESLSSFFDKYVHGETNLRGFIERYKVILEDRYEEEAKADFDAWHETPELKSPSPFEKQMSLVYTHEIFKKFQVEVLGAAACHLNKEKEDEATITYAVTDLEDNQDFIVEWNESKSNICCSCRLFEYNGYLCRHAIVVLQMSGVFSIPFKYILQRWTNAATSRHAISERLDDIQSKVRHYNDLCRRAIILGEEGSLSQESYNIALGAIKEALKQCASVNNSTENDLRLSTSVPLAIHGSEEDNQGSATCKEQTPNLKMTKSNKASKRVESGKEKANDANKRKKVSFELDNVDNVGTQGGFHQMVFSTWNLIEVANEVSVLSGLLCKRFWSCTFFAFDVRIDPPLSHLG
ncbi:hypothetical protein HYC85_024700 [Camellia sinensis]|uniref:Protein FAR1-RELATED SEQUENCE n=1 Tax=Camellia sinensis TaxID=4442 RepID=A0A7J7GCT5_CAMSI|nr:hypothetical protein HYC85_024700 [Camellia sinensis]